MFAQFFCENFCFLQKKSQKSKNKLWILYMFAWLAKHMRLASYRACILLANMRPGQVKS